MATPALRVVAYDAHVFRNAWRASLLVTVVTPVLFLGAMGLGLGGLVRGGRPAIAGVHYIDFLAPGLLATTAMQTAAMDTTYPIMVRLEWNRLYEAMLNTPLRVRDLLTGELLWVALRLLGICVVFLAVAACFGTVHTPAALLAVPVAVLTGMAFGAPILAFSATQRNDTGFNAINRFIVIPLFLLGGSFFPITQLPRPLQGIAWLTPLTHGVAQCRDLMLGRAGLAPALVHVTVLLAYTTVGVLLAVRTMHRRLLV